MSVFALEKNVIRMLSFEGKKRSIGGKTTFNTIPVDRVTIFSTSFQIPNTLTEFLSAIELNSRCILNETKIYTQSICFRQISSFFLVSFHNDS